MEAALAISNEAVQADRTGAQPTEAARLYSLAAAALRKLAIDRSFASNADALASKAFEYEKRSSAILGNPELETPPSTSKVLKPSGSGSPATSRAVLPLSTKATGSSSAAQLTIRANKIFRAGRQDHAEHRPRDASTKYQRAAEIYLEALSVATSEEKAEITRRATEALENAEQLQRALGTTFCGPASVDAGRTGTCVASTNPSPSAKKPSTTGGTQSKGNLTKAESEVLAATSTINGRIYLPWVDDDAREDFSVTGPAFRDPDGVLVLAAKQKERFEKWLRPTQLFDSPKMILEVVGDCSFVCSLAISADYERRFKVPIITNRIFPRKKGLPAYNPNGRYIVKLHFNGVWRRVVIDDVLPSSRGGGLLCSYSNNAGELWVSLIEKAYLKVMGGYDFPGSNSGVDMHALTGWIPERLQTDDAGESDWISQFS